MLVAFVPVASAIAATAGASALPSARVVEEGGLVRFAAGPGSVALAEPLSDTARSFALQHTARLGLTGSSLMPGEVDPSALGRAVRLPATLNGLPLLGAEVVVALDRDGKVRRVASSARPIDRVTMAHAVTSREAISVAARGLSGLTRREGSPLGSWGEVFYQRGGEARLAYQIHLASQNLLQNYVALVDAQTGELVWRRNLVFFSDAARVYQPHPGVDGTRPLASVSLEPFLPAPPERDPNGYLVGTLLDSMNCCAHEGCQAERPPKIASGMVTDEQGNWVPADFPYCDLQHRANNALAGRTDFDYSAPDPLSYDPPTNPIGSDAGDSDEFSEVHGFYHANVAYAFFRSLSPGFQLRDAKRGSRTQVIANMLLTGAVLGADGKVGFSLRRNNNAAFVPRPEPEYAIPGLLLDERFEATDVIALFQGDAADFAYDGDVIYHEFAHAVVFATARFFGPHLDTYGALDEAGAMHEGLADYFAAAITQDSKSGDWIGSRLQAGGSAIAEHAVRDLDNSRVCPELLTGEVHNDSQHFSGALWSLRKAFAAADAGRTFDLAVFDALQTIPGGPYAGFKEMAEAIATSVGEVFPDIPDAHGQVMAAFRARGVVDCVRVLEYVEPRSFYGLPGTNAGYHPFAPGPIQFKLPCPEGASWVSVTAAAGLMYESPSAKVLVRRNAPLAFGTDSWHIAAQSDGGADLQPNSTGGLTASVPVWVLPGESLYVSLVNAGGEPLLLTGVSLKVVVPPAAQSCGCSTAEAAPVLAAAAILLALLRRRC